MPDIVKKVFGDEPTADFKFELTGTLPEVDLLRAVPGDRLQLRQPPDGGGRHLLLRQAHGRPQHRGAHRFHRQAHAVSRLRDDPVHRARAGRAAGARAHQQLGLRARDPAWRLRARRLRSRAAERRAARRRRRCPRSYAPSDYEVYDYPGHYLQKADGEQYAAVRIDELGSQFETAQAVDQRQGDARSDRCSRSRTARARIRTAST